MLSTDYNQHGYIVYMYAVTFIPPPPPPPPTFLSLHPLLSYGDLTLDEGWGLLPIHVEDRKGKKTVIGQLFSDLVTFASYCQPF